MPSTLHVFNEETLESRGGPVPIIKNWDQDNNEVHETETLEKYMYVE